MSDSDFTQRFLFDEFDARGELVSLRDSYAHVLAKHPYPQPVAQLLGELLAAAALLVGLAVLDRRLDRRPETRRDPGREAPSGP